MMHCVGRRSAARGVQQAMRRAHVGSAAGQQRAFHFRAQSSTSSRSYSSGSSVQRDVASAASFFLDAKAACKNKRCALGKDHSGIVANPAACGEDSFFLSPQIVGVADGVGGWNESGVDPGEISRCLMRNAGQFVKRQAELKKDVSTLDVLSYGYAQALADDAVEAGSTTACIIKIKELGDGKPVLEYSNLGDSGFCIIRDGKVIFRSKFQVRTANRLLIWGVCRHQPLIEGETMLMLQYYGRAPYQLAKIPLRFKEYGAIENHPNDVSALLCQVARRRSDVSRCGRGYDHVVHGLTHCIHCIVVLVVVSDVAVRLG